MVKILKRREMHLVKETYDVKCKNCQSDLQFNKLEGEIDNDSDDQRASSLIKFKCPVCSNSIVVMRH